MGSSGDPGSNGKAIDASVGGLVWVRRRNGSWWPGRIMGLDEISEGSLVSPRSGTPVKLLGREDASVDWYNLEKSKRVKAFRCGEYDECIEKAKVSAANGNKKAVKYARREDAILHALEIENARLGRGNVHFSRTNDSGAGNGNLAKESASMSLSRKEDEDMNIKESGSDDPDSDSDSGFMSGADSGSALELSQSGISFEEPNHNGASKMQTNQGKRRRTPNDSEDDGTEGTKRMRGLEDLGMTVGDSSTGNCMSNGTFGNGHKMSNSSIKRKRSQTPMVNEFLKRKNRRRPLTKVLESTAMVSVPVTCDQLPNSCGSLQGLSDGKISGVDSNDSKRSLCLAVNNNNSDSNGVSCDNGTSLNPCENDCDTSLVNPEVKKENDIPRLPGSVENDSSDRLFDVPFVGEEKHTAGMSPMLSSSLRHQVDGLRRQSGQNSQAEAMSSKNEGINESASTSSAAKHFSISQRIEKGTSKWHRKGKRNSRHVNKNRKRERYYVDMDDEANTYSADAGQMGGFLQGSDQKFDGHGNRRTFASFGSNLQVKSTSAEDRLDRIGDWGKPFSLTEPRVGGASGDASLPPQRLLPFRQSRFTVNSKYETSDFPGRNGRSASKLFDVKLEVRANYRPQHVPLVSLMSKLNGKAIVGRPLTVEPLDDGYCDEIITSCECDATHESVLEVAEQSNTVMRTEAGRIPTKQSRFSPSKSAKLRKSGLLSKKIRKLSSLTRNKEEYKKPVVEKPKGPVIACIPLKLVFSRINEGMNGSARQMQQQQQQRASTSDNS
ncbi:hypothetical protein K2173_024339 [Erythroxylum novogranatense]|uniref:PWWP domain-containing protein n=1 Tax=Erythroxylum novogranatense TaxID=1862640 RepID=A0AAV8SUV0_9ROSI|nr:hypothetical protein K2173_024339 [Erythroxylum novogranatense]